MKFLLILLCTLPLYSVASSKAELTQAFKQAYRQYQSAEESGDTKSLNKSAKQAYELGLTLFGQEDLNTANLAMNWAGTLLNSNKSHQANELLLSALPVFLEKLGDDNLDMVPVYQQIARSYGRKDYKNNIRYLKRALTVLRKNKEESPFLVANLQTEIGTALLSLGDPASRILVKANDELSKQLAANDKRLINSNFYVGKYYLSRGKVTSAIEYLSKNIPIFESLDGPSHHLELVSRAFLVQAYEKKGESEEATAHCLAIGAMTPWQEDQDQQPLYRIEPRYPMSAARSRKNGWVQLSFNVTPSGFVEDIKVLNNEGHKGFIRASKEAVEKWRYAPKFENGKPVKASASVQLDFKIAS